MSTAMRCSPLTSSPPGGLVEAEGGNSVASKVAKWGEHGLGPYLTPLSFRALPSRCSSR